MKKFIVILLIFIIQSFYAAEAKTIKVKSLVPFDSTKPPVSYKVELLEPFFIEPENLYLYKGYILNGYIDRIITPKRLKQDATFIYVPTEYSDLNGNRGKIKNLVGARTTNVDKRDLVIGSALMLTIGAIPAILTYTGYYAAEGAIKNKEQNKVKSSIDNVYEKTCLSLGEKGKDLHISKNEEFLLNLAIIKSQEPNYTFTPVN